MIKESLRQGQLRGYSFSAWKARYHDLLIHDEAYRIGIAIARESRKLRDIEILCARKHEVMEEFNRSYLMDCSDGKGSSD